jgi:hypothetical protein
MIRKGWPNLPSQVCYENWLVTVEQCLGVFQVRRLLNHPQQSVRQASKKMPVSDTDPERIEGTLKNRL